MRAADIMLQKFGAPVLIDCIYEPELNPNDGKYAVRCHHVCVGIWGSWVWWRGDTSDECIIMTISRSNHLPFSIPSFHSRAPARNFGAALRHGCVFVANCVCVCAWRIGCLARPHQSTKPTNQPNQSHIPNPSTYNHNEPINQSYSSIPNFPPPPHTTRRPRARDGGGRAPHGARLPRDAGGGPRGDLPGKEEGAFVCVYIYVCVHRFRKDFGVACAFQVSLSPPPTNTLHTHPKHAGAHRLRGRAGHVGDRRPLPPTSWPRLPGQLPLGGRHRPLLVPPGLALAGRAAGAVAIDRRERGGRGIGMDCHRVQVTKVEMRAAV